MPRRLYPSHTGRFGGLNRQLMYARGRLNRFRNEASGRNYPQMPGGVAGEEWHPEEYKSTEMWADVEQRLHEILKNPPKVHRDPQTDAEKQENYEANFASNPQLIQEQMRGDTMREVAGGKSEEQIEKQNEKKFKVAATLAEGRHKVYMDMKKTNASHAGTYPETEMDTALESRNAAYRGWHEVAEESGYGDISQSFPELHKSGRTKKSQEAIDKSKIKKTAASKRADPYLNIVMGEMGLPGIASGGIPPQKQLDALNAAGPALDQQLADGEISAKEWQDAVDAIKKGKTLEDRVDIAQKTLKGTAAQAMAEVARPPAKLPQHMAGAEAGVPGSDVPGAGMAEFPSPETPLLGEGEEQLGMGMQEAGPEALMEPPPDQMGGVPQPQMDMFQKLPARGEIGKVPGRFRTPRRGRVRKGGVKEE